MGLSVIKVFKAAKYQIHETQNGEFSGDDFNLQSELGELKLLGWVTGKPDHSPGPTPFDSQKLSDWISPLVKTDKQNVVKGRISKPVDYYTYDNMFSLFLPNISCEKDDENGNDEEDVQRIPVELMQRQKFLRRANTSIKSLRPSLLKPIAKEIGKEFEFLPRDLGSIELEYIAYPEKYGRIEFTIDQQFMEEVPDPVLSQDYVWGEWAMEILVWFIVDGFANRTRDAALKNSNAATGKLTP